MTTVELPGGIHLTRSGYGSDPAVIFLHGFLGSADDWAPIAAGVSNRVTASLDLPGHGRSAEAVEAAYSFAGSLDWLSEAVVALGGGPVDLTGYSMGGRIALHFALERPELVRSLLLESVSPGIEQEALRRQRANLDRERADRIRTAGLDSFVHDWYRQPLFESVMQRPDLVESLLERRRHGRAETMARALEAFSPGHQPSLWGRLSTITCPVTYVAGELDERYVRVGHDVARKTGHATVRVVQGAGHNVHLEQPARFATIMHQHLDRLT